MNYEQAVKMWNYIKNGQNFLDYTDCQIEQDGQTYPGYASNYKVTVK